MKKISLLLVSFITIMGAACTQAYETSIQYNKKKHTAIAIDYMYPPEAVENAFIQKMEKLGYRSKEEKGLFNRDKGFLLFKDAYVADISTDRMDYSIKVERKSRKENDESVLYLVLSKDGELSLIHI